MTDDQPTPVEDTSVTESAPEVEGHAPDEHSPINWEQRYGDLRPKFDQTAQEAAEYREMFEHLTNPDTQGEALRMMLGVELQDADEDEDLEDLDDLSPAVLQRLEQLEQQLQERDQRAEQAAEAEAVSEHVADAVDALQDQVGELTEQEVHILVARAIQIPDENNMPDIGRAWSELSGVYDNRLKKWAKTKRTPGIPGGQSAKQAIDLSTEKSRAEYIDERLNAADITL